MSAAATRVPRECPHCGETFITRRTTSRFCSPPCYLKAYVAAHAEKTLTYQRAYFAENRERENARRTARYWREHPEPATRNAGGWYSRPAATGPRPRRTGPITTLPAPTHFTHLDAALLVIDFRLEEGA